MFVLHVELQVKPGAQKALEDTFVGTFTPVEDGGEYRLSIAFDDRTAQQQWVATDLHNAVWPQMEGHCLGYSVKNFFAV